ncbi:unnamed protein product, partial [Symbiodinium sp. KB8]
HAEAGEFSTVRWGPLCRRCLQQLLRGCLGCALSGDEEQRRVPEEPEKVPKQQIREVPKHIPRVETRCVEKIQSVPVNLLHEVAVEVPQVLRHEVITEVQGQQTEQRVVQTAQEVERRVNRSEVVVGSESERFQGAYDAKVVRVEAPTPSNYSDTYLNEGLVIRSKSPTPTRARL